MSDYYDYPEFEFDKEIDIKVDTNINFDTNIDFDKTKDVDINVNSDVNIEGNFAELLLDVEAIGKDTLVEVDSSILVVEDKLSSVTVSAMAGAG